MPRLSTAAKLAIARALRKIVGIWLALTGADPTAVECVRRGVRWSLNLDEGVQLAIYLGLYEGSTTGALERLVKPDATVVDIGANIGAHAIPVANRLAERGRLIAVEPADEAIARLRKNASLNPKAAARLTVVHRALLAEGEAPAKTYFASWPLAGEAGMHPVHQGAALTSTAAGSTLDHLFGELGVTHVDVIKLDVDGNELPVLRGGAATLAASQPVVVFELAPYLLEERSEPVTALTRFFLDLGYKLYDEATFKPLPAAEEELLRSIPKGGSLNVIASMRPLS